MYFEWDDKKNKSNIQKHGISFEVAQYAFKDENRILTEDEEHSGHEKRYFCFGKIAEHVITIRFTYRKNNIRIIGAGYWRIGRRIYEKENNSLHK